MVNSTDFVDFRSFSDFFWNSLSESKVLEIYGIAMRGLMAITGSHFLTRFAFSAIYFSIYILIKVTYSY